MDLYAADFHPRASPRSSVLGVNFHERRGDGKIANENTPSGRSRNEIPLVCHLLLANDRRVSFAAREKELGNCIMVPRAGGKFRAMNDAYRIHVQGCHFPRVGCDVLLINGPGVLQRLRLRFLLFLIPNRVQWNCDRNSGRARTKAIRKESSSKSPRFSYSFRTGKYTLDPLASRVTLRRVL